MCAGNLILSFSLICGSLSEVKVEGQTIKFNLNPDNEKLVEENRTLATNNEFSSSTSRPDQYISHLKASF